MHILSHAHKVQTPATDECTRLATPPLENHYILLLSLIVRQRRCRYIRRYTRLEIVLSARHYTEIQV
jgi:hypothetical protein